MDIKPSAARNRAIASDRQAGMSLSDLADKYGISRERIRQIALREERSVRNFDPANIMDETPIGEVPFSARIHNCLKRANIRTIGQLRNASNAELLELPNLGRVSIDECRAVAPSRAVGNTEFEHRSRKLDKIHKDRMEELQARFKREEMALIHEHYIELCAELKNLGERFYAEAIDWHRAHYGP